MQKEENRGKRGGFTLAELLVVLVIVGVIFAITLPALTGLTGQSRLQGAANVLHATTKMARQYALAHNQPTYLVFHDDQSTADINLIFRSYAVFTIDTHAGLQTTQADGQFLTDWNVLPPGIVFDNETTDGQSNVFIIGGQGWNGGFNRFRLLRIESTSYVVLGFKPQGTTFRSYKNDIHLTEGLYRDGTLVRTSDEGLRIRVDSMGRSHITSTFYAGGANE